MPSMTAKADPFNSSSSPRDISRPIIGSPRCLGVKHKIASGAINAALGQAAMNALDNVAALAQRAKDAFGFLRHHPLSGAERRREAEPLQLARASDEHCALDIHGLIADGPKVDYPIMARGLAREGLVERRPAIGVDLPLETAENLLLAARPEFQVHELRGAGAKTSADIVATDDEIGAIVRPSARQDMDVGMLGVPVIDGDPIDLGPEIA